MATPHERRYPAWTTLATAGLIAAGVAACSQGPSPLQPDIQSTIAGSTAIQADSALNPQLAAVRAGTAQFHDVEVAIAAGYRSPVGQNCEETAAGAMGIHSPKFSLMPDQILDPEHPEVLLYLPKAGGGFRLVGVEYVQFVLLLDPATGQVAPWTSPEPWPSTYQVVTPTPELYGQTFNGPMAGHFPGMPWHWDLHVWAWAPNPSGMFAQWNPSISCGA